jgi:SAM-dependent methyltransferase
MNKNILFWEDIINNPTKLYNKWFKEERKFLIENIKKDSSVLEVGCGDGRSLKDLLKVTKNLTGVDHDKDAVLHSKVNFKDFPTVKIILAEGKSLPFKDNTFDYVTCIGTFANFGDEKLIILEEIKRILKHDGKIIISVYSEDALEERLKTYKKHKVIIKEIKKDGTVILDINRDGISEQFSQNKLVEIFNKVHLRLDKIIKAGIGYICLLSKEQ